ncbi:MAG: O-methyltransferase [Bacilli bacterium]|nr:O-methyltransferase [Bacilli bacterium]
MVELHHDIKELKEYAKENNVPIMMEDGINFLTTFVIKHQTKTVLEIGTAIGYSAIMMALASPNLKITSIERDEERYLEAVKNIKKFKLEDRITLIYRDAEEVELKEKFDLVFIDAAKGKNMMFFEKFSKNLNQNGFIITDNINFHGYVNKDESKIKSRNLRGLVRKIKDYISFLKENEEFKTEFYETGDGIAVSTRI